MERSIEELKKHHEALKTTWGIDAAEEAAIPDVTLDEFCRRIAAHVD